MTAILEAHDLGRWYGDVVGLSDLTLTLDSGVVGLLGPNGAGKSTFLKLVVGELRPSRGTLRVLGHEPFANQELFRRLGFAPQQDALWGDLTALEMVAFLLQLSGFSRGAARDRAVRALERVKLHDAMERKTRGYSKGMRQRVRIAQAIAHDPELLVLDEPLTGLDPLARRDTLDLLAELARSGTSLLVSSHVLHEVEELTHDVVLLHRGRLLAKGAAAEIRALLDQRPRRVEFFARDNRKLARALLDLEGTLSVRIGPDGKLAVETNDLDGLQIALPAITARERPGVRAFEIVDTSLEALFDDLVGGVA